MAENLKRERFTCPACGRDVAGRNAVVGGFRFPPLYPHYDKTHWPWSECPGEQVWYWTAWENESDEHGLYLRHWRYLRAESKRLEAWLPALQALVGGDFEPGENMLEEWDREQMHNIRVHEPWRL